MVTNQSDLSKDMTDEIVNIKRMGDKKFHSETSLQQYDENEDPGAAGPINDPEESNCRLLPKLAISNKEGDDSGVASAVDSYRIYTTVNDGRSGAIRPKHYGTTLDAQSIQSVETHAPPPTNPEDNKRLTTKHLTLKMSCLYGIVLVTLGIIIYICDPFIAKISISPIFSIILSGIGFLYHIYLLADISRYKSVALKNLKIKNEHEDKLAARSRIQEEYFDTSDDSTIQQMVPTAVLIPMKHDYCFSQDRQSISFYLTMGATAFAIGRLVHSLLMIAVQVSYWLNDNINNDKCVNTVQLVLDVFNPIYSFLQVYFIFKYSNVIILKGQGLARFAFIHIVSSSLCFWIYAIIRETTLALTIYASSKAKKYYGHSKNDTTTTVSDVKIDLLSLDIDNFYNENCSGSSTIFSIFENVSPYLYSFSIEYNILIVAVYYIIWSNIDNCHNDHNNSEKPCTLDNDNTVGKIPKTNKENYFTSNIVNYANCHASSRGLFAGMVAMVIIVGMLIIGFVFNSVGKLRYLKIGYLLKNITTMCMHTAMLVAVMFAYNQIRKLDINKYPISFFNHILLFICLPAFVIQTIFSMVATISILNVVKTIDCAVMLIQILTQTTLLVDGLRRCSNSKKLCHTKPGRDLLMFLLITNVGMWLFNTFSFKSPKSLDERYTFYGKFLWTIIGHLSLPLMMFYRFHSSVCLAVIWDSAYKPASEH